MYVLIGTNAFEQEGIFQTDRPTQALTRDLSKHSFIRIERTFNTCVRINYNIVRY